MFKTAMITLLAALATLYLAVMLAMFLAQRRLLYLPQKQLLPPAAYGLVGFSDHFLKTAEGRLQLWLHPARGQLPTILYFHGNAGNLGDRRAIFAALAGKGFGLIALSYPGYGASDGSPTEQAIYAAARAAMHYAMQERKLPLEQIVLYGESLGSGVAVHVAAEYKVAALALQSPYTSVAARAAEIYYYLPVRWLIRDRFDSIDKIGAVASPLIIFQGERDRTIPPAHARALFEKAAGPKQAYYFPEVDHNDFDSEQLAAHLMAFAQAHAPAKAP